MAFPIIPILVGGLILMAAGGKRRKKDNGVPPNPPGMDVIAIPPAGPPPPGSGGNPGDPCDTGDALTYGAYDEQGNCKVFWTPETWDVMTSYAQIAWEELGSPDDLCAADEYLEYKDEWVPNPTKQQVAVRAAAAAYQVPTTHFPPAEDAPYWVRMVWDRTIGVINNDLCGMGGA